MADRFVTRYEDPNTIDPYDPYFSLITKYAEPDAIDPYDPRLFSLTPKIADQPVALPNIMDQPVILPKTANPSISIPELSKILEQTAPAQSAPKTIGKPSLIVPSIPSNLNSLADKYEVTGSLPDIIVKPPLDTVKLPETQPIPVPTKKLPIQFGTPQMTPAVAPAIEIPAPAPAPAAVGPDMMALLQKYMPPVVDYGTQIADVSKRRAQEQAAFNAALDKMVANPEEGPSKAEMYFRLAAAFGAPTKTGKFMESVGEASKVLGEYSKEKRLAREAGRAKALEVELKKRQMSLEDLRESEKDLRSMYTEDIKSRREMAKEVIKDWIASGKPMSEAGKAALDMGLKPGTPEYQAQVTQNFNMQVDKANLQLQAIASSMATQAGHLTLAQKEFAQKQGQLSPAEIKIADDLNDRINATERTKALIGQALNYVDKAYTRSVGDRMQYATFGATMSNDPKVVATEQLEQILTKSGLEGLRAAFGGNPTEGERAIQLATQGLEAKSVESRKEIINRIINMINSQLEKDKARLQEVQSGRYGQKR